MVDESIILGGIKTLRTLGFFDFLLPFLLFFAVIYAILAKSKIFESEPGKERRDINAVVAFVIAMIATTTSWVLLALNQFLPWVGFITIVLLGFLILGSMVYGGDVTAAFKENPVMRNLAVGLVGFVVFIVMYYALGWQSFFNIFGLSNVDYALILIGIILIIVLYVMFKGGKPENKTAPSK
ncbi:MAG: hypothetical protein PHC66_03810 [Candidatus Nanoarchaeia archaeon]|nr:hypothetical protein [Candidatus Nanoarchaeia archaeon]MDD5239221.1 hypothetical protein [Candidatus Nanoarchaeia archaeon]